MMPSGREARASGRAVRVCLLVLAAAVVLVVRLQPLTLGGAGAERDQFTWRAADGRDHAYLGDYDSYLWVREARNYLRSGTTCDAVVAGDCRDAFTLAPVGVEMRYARSLHVAAIVGVRRLIRLFDPKFPLTASAIWVPIIVAVLGVFPAFAIGNRLAGAMGGFAAALAIGLNPLFFERSAGGDNDVWNVVLPLCAVWAAMAAVASPSRGRRLWLAAVAGGVVGLHAAIWQGWIFTHVVVLAGLGATALIELLRPARTVTPARQRLSGAPLALATYWLAAAAAGALAGVGSAALTQPFVIARSLFPTAAAVAPAPGPAWPNVFGTVAELTRPGLPMIAYELLGPVYLFIAWLGMLVLVLPERRWRWWHFAVLIGGTLLYRVLVVAPGLARPVLIALLALPLIAALLGSLWPTGSPEKAMRSGALLVLVWFLAALFMAFGGIRFVMLLVPPCGLLVGVALGRLHAWLVRVAQPRAGRHARLAAPVLFVVVALALVPPVRLGIAAARSYHPRMNDAWWDTLVQLRDTSPPDAIVSTWWDYGHWVKYVAERRVNIDGSTLRTHVPHWLARALLAPTERETVGLLRMLACGSDAAPNPEGRLGAWGKLVHYGADPVAAYATVLHLATLDKEAARADLLAHGFAPAAADDVLRSTHCTAPPDYLVLSSEMVIGSAWRSIGSWDARRAWLIDAVGQRPQAEIVADLTSRLDMAPAEARALYARATDLEGKQAVAEFVSPPLGYLVPRWSPCTGPDHGAWTCPVKGRADDAVLATVEYDPEAPAETRLRVGDENRAATAVLLAGSEHVREIAGAGRDTPPLGILVDVPGRRVLVGSPGLLRSTFTRLMFLDARLARHFEPVADRTGYANERVRAWRIR